MLMLPLFLLSLSLVLNSTTLAFASLDKEMRFFLMYLRTRFSAMKHSAYDSKLKAASELSSFTQSSTWSAVFEPFGGS